MIIVVTALLAVACASISRHRVQQAAQFRGVCRAGSTA